MLAQLRNVQTGEIRPVELDSDEFRTMLMERFDAGDGRAFPRWEQTGDHVTRRIDEGGTHVPEDFGHEDSDIGDDKISPAEEQLLQADPHPERSLTVAEREAGIESYEHKVELQAHERTGGGAEKIERGLERVGVAGDGAQALESSKGKANGSSEGSGSATKADLKAQADDLGITGTSSMNKSELQAAIDEHNAGDGSGS